MDIFNTWLVKKNIAHRGLHNDDAPENTLAAFKRAMDAGFPIELDVREIDDGTVIVFHDDKLSRLTGIDGFASQLTMSELSEMRILKSDQKIPLFAEVLEFVNGTVPLLIEIKNSSKVGSLEKAVIELLKKYQGEYAVQSFNPYSMEYFKLNAPHIIRGQLSCFFKDSDLSRIKRYALKHMLLNRKVSEPNFIAYDAGTLPNRIVNRFSSLPILAWTIRSNAEYERVKPHCSNIIFEGFFPEE